MSLEKSIRSFIPDEMARRGLQEKRLGDRKNPRQLIYGWAMLRLYLQKLNTRRNFGLSLEKDNPVIFKCTNVQVGTPTSII